MWILWIIFALLVVIAAVWLLRPLFKTYSDAALQEMEQKVGKRKELNIELFKQKQAQVEQDFAIGLIDEDGLQQAQNELEHSLLQEADDSDETPLQQLDGRSSKALGFVIALFIPVFSVIIYLILMPDNLQQIVMAEKLPTQQAQGQAPDIDAMVKSLEKKLLENPNNLQGWVMLGRSYTHLKKYDKAVNAYAKAMELDQSGNNEVTIDYGEALMQTGTQSNYRLAHQVFQQLLEREPENPDALWFIGFLDYEAGNKDKTIQHWTKLLSILPADSEEAKVVNNYLARAKQQTGTASAAQQPASKPATPPAPAANTVVAGKAPVFEDKASEQAFINSMIARVEQRVKDNPDDIKSWKMLGKSYAVQERYADSAQAYARAIALEGNDVQVLMDYTEAVMKTGDKDQMNKARELLGQLIEKKPNYTDALYLSGSLARAAGDNEDARKLWSRLLAMLTKDTPAYNNVEKNLKALD